MNLIEFFFGVAAVLGVGFLAMLLFRAVTVAVEDEAMVLAMSFGRIDRRLLRPGLHFYPAKIFPWVKITHLSLQRDFREYAGQLINDQNGTAVVIDLWIEFRVATPEKALFAVEDWEQALRNHVIHSATSLLCGRTFDQILSERKLLSELLFKEVLRETQRWGIDVKRVLLKNVSLLPEVSRQVLESVAAKLERAKAMVEEEGRLKVEQINAKTELQVADLTAQAKAQYSLHVGRAYQKLKAKPQILNAYKELFRLARQNPMRTIVFDGFAGSADPITAATLMPSLLDDDWDDNVNVINK